VLNVLRRIENWRTENRELKLRTRSANYELGKAK
jgi:hypothetical protein